MTGGRWQAQVIRKDLWALGPAWLAFAATAVLGSVVFRNPAGALIAYVLGSAVLGALAIGHEYGHGTLPVLLAQPVSRPQLLLVKLGVLANMLAALFVVSLAAGAGLSAARLVREVPWNEVVVLLLPLLCGLFVAPWLTMLARGALGGTVFTGGLLAILWFAGDALGLATYGLPSGNFAKVDAFQMAFFSWGAVGLCAVAALLIQPTFRRLQATSGPGVAISLPRWRWLGVPTAARRLRASDSRRRHWISQLVGKELHLHQMVFVVTALYLVGWFALRWSRQYLPPGFALPLAPVTWLYGATVALLLGSFTSAEERQLGTLASQLLQPVSTRLQWIVKVATAVALAVLLGIVLPSLLETFVHLQDSNNDPMTSWQPAMVGSFLVAGIYVSSLSTSGMKALIVAMPVGAIALSLSSAGFSVFRSLTIGSYQAFEPGFHGMYGALVDRRTLIMFAQWLLVAVALLPAGIAVWFAFGNYRSSERFPRLVLRQTLWTLIWLVLVPIVHGLILAWFHATSSRT